MSGHIGSEKSTGVNPTAKISRTGLVGIFSLAAPGFTRH
jgi:hypothetical protein